MVDYLPSVELLESTHEFPCSYVLKVIGEAHNDFVARIVAAVRDELEHAEDPPFRFRQTKGGRHVSVTLEPRVQSAFEVLALYGRLRDTEGVMMMM